MRRCPECGLVSPDETEVCDCGYGLTAGARLRPAPVRADGGIPGGASTGLGIVAAIIAGAIAAAIAAAVDPRWSWPYILTVSGLLALPPIGVSAFQQLVEKRAAGLFCHALLVAGAGFGSFALLGRELLPSGALRSILWVTVALLGVALLLDLWRKRRSGASA